MYPFRTLFAVAYARNKRQIVMVGNLLDSLWRRPLSPDFSTGFGLFTGQEPCGNS